MPDIYSLIIGKCQVDFSFSKDGKICKYIAAHEIIYIVVCILHGHQWNFATMKLCVFSSFDLQKSANA